MKTLFLFVLCVAFKAEAATTFTEFYCDFANGDNLNSGSTTNALAVYSGVGDSDGTSVFTPSDGSTPASTVSAGMWGNVYVTAGAVTNTFNGRIVTVAAGVNGAVTFDTSAKSGTFPAASSGAHTISLKVGGAWKGPNAAVLFPCGFVTATMTNLNTGVAQGFSPRVNFKNGATYAITASITQPNAGPIRWQGMTQWGTPGDLGKATIDCATVGAGVIIITASGVNNDYADLIFSNSGATSGTTDGFVLSGNECTAIRCVAHDIRRDGILVSSSSTLLDCEVYLANKSNTSGKCGIDMSIAGATAIRCISHDNAGNQVSGFLISADCKLINCIADTNGKDGATISSTVATLVFGCDFYNNVATGIDLTGGSAAQFVIQNCNFVKNGTWGINSSGSFIRNGVISSCGFGVGTQANSTGDINVNAGMNITGTVNYPTGLTPWVDPANGDFRINLAQAKGVGSGSFTETQASYAGTVGKPDIGAAQSGMQRSSTF